jgi:hypothetical protein
MARTKTTWQPGQGGKPKGAKDEVPRSFKASIRAVYEKLQDERPELFVNAIERGLMSRRPKEAFPYVKLYAELIGEMKQQVELTGSLNVEQADALALRTRTVLDELAARLASGSSLTAGVAEAGEK